MYRIRIAVGLISLVVLGRCAAAVGDNQTVSVSDQPGKYRVTVGDQLFCVVDYRSYPKPIVYPIYGPGQIPMTRRYPMQDAGAGEAKDHPHHKSMWFGHGDVNGISFWDEKGSTRTETAEIVADSDLTPTLRGQPTVRLKNQLISSSGNQVSRETILLSFGANEKTRWIDWHITMHADDDSVRIGDTKEGTAALRVHANLRPDNKATQGTDMPPARAINSEGDEGPDIWGKRAKWVDYSGTINGHLVGIAFFDSPNNLRHPTHWHARTYGLFAANPFGHSFFVGEDHDGSHIVPAGESLTLRYRVVFHGGDAKAAHVPQLYESYSNAVK